MNLKQRIAAWIEQNRQSDDDQAALIADILYHYHGENAAEMLDSAAIQYRMAEWIVERYAIKNPAFEAKVKRDKGGKFAKQAGKSSESAKIAILQELKKPPTPKGVQSLVDSLSQMTVKDLTQFKKEQGISASGRTKADLVAKIADRLSRGRREVAEPKKKKQVAGGLGELAGQTVMKKLTDPQLTAIQEEFARLHEWNTEADRLERETRQLEKTFAQLKGDARYAAYNVASQNIQKAKQLREQVRTKSIEALQRVAGTTEQKRKLTFKSRPSKGGKLTTLSKSVTFEKPGKQYEFKQQTAEDYLTRICGVETDIPLVHCQLEDNERAFCLTSQGRVLVPKTENVQTFIHEIAHALEAKIGAEKSIEFRDARIAKSETAYVRMKEMFPNHSYDDNEMGNEDSFGPAMRIRKPSASGAFYAGKDYGRGSTEIVTMGLEAMYNNAPALAVADPEYFKFLVAYVNGKL